MRKGRIVILSGPSGSGKTTLYKKILSDKIFKGYLIRSISATTRPKRTQEVCGRDYLFLSKADFLRKKQQGYFLETQKVFHDYYGTPLQPVRQSLRAGQNVLLCIEVKGAKVVYKKTPYVLQIFIKPPSFRVLRERLSHRGTEGKTQLQRRFQRAKMELKEAKNYDYQIINDKLGLCYQQLKNILIKELMDRDVT